MAEQTPEIIPSEPESRRRPSRSPSPTLIFPLPKQNITNEEQGGQPESASGTPLPTSADSDTVFHFSPPDGVLNKSDNSLGALCSSAQRTHSRSPDGRRMGRRRSQSSRESARHDSQQSVDMTASEIVTSTSKRGVTVVTDLDQAMAQMDEMKLKSMFGKPMSESACLSEAPLSTSTPQSPTDVDETNIDEDSPSVKKISDMRQKSLEASSVPDVTPTPKASHTSHGKRRLYSTDNVCPVINFQDAIKLPENIPDELFLSKQEEFDGASLTSWLGSPFNESHYLHQILTHHDVRVMMSQFCTYLLSAGVLLEVDKKNKGEIFKAQNQYRWSQQQQSHVEQPPPSRPTVDESHTPIRAWPPHPATVVTSPEPTCASTSTETTPADFDQLEVERPGLKYTEAEHQESLAQLRREYKELERRLQSEHEAEMGRIQEGFTSQIERLSGQIVDLQKEVKKYKTLAGIEELTQDALDAAEAASKEAGLGPSERVLAVTGTPNIPNGTSDGPPPPPPPPPPPSGLGGPPPPPPPPPPGGAGPPPPPPPPPPGGPGMGGKDESRKPIINPRKPMKPLFWKRLQVHALKSKGHNSIDKKNFFWEKVEEENLNFDHFVDLFSKTTSEPKRRSTASQLIPKTVQPAKVLQPKRSQAVGILLSSLRLEFSEIEMAILNLDTSILGTEKFQAIYHARPDSDEMRDIKKQLDKQPDVPLDRPEQFLWDFQQIPQGADRIFCFIFQSTFQESMTSIDCKLNNLKMTCDILSTYESVRRIFGLILACGNYMNGGSRTRGQADGFDLEILPKLKDVKGKDNRTSLLQFVVTHYVHRYDSELMGTDRAKLPIPDPSDIHQAGMVHFDDIQSELKRLHKDFESADRKANQIISTSSKENMEPFKSMMTVFFNKGRQDLKEQAENIGECHKVFIDCVQFFCVKPKAGEKEVTPEYFFSLWLTFCTDFKNMWKKEQQAVMKLRIREAEERVRKIKESKTALPPTRARKIGGLKDRLSRHGKLN